MGCCCDGRVLYALYDWYARKRRSLYGQQSPGLSVRHVGALSATSGRRAEQQDHENQGILGDDSRFPVPEGNSLNAAGINDQALKATAALKRLHELENNFGTGKLNRVEDRSQ